jgi:hypothetical protein
MRTTSRLSACHWIFNVSAMDLEWIRRGSEVDLEWITIGSGVDCLGMFPLAGSESVIYLRPAVRIKGNAGERPRT